MPTRKKKILLVEDNEINARLISDYLTYKRYKVVIVEDGNNVIASIKLEKPDLILMDLQLNGLSGVEVIKQIRSHSNYKKIPIIVVSAFSRDKINEVLTADYFEEFLEKPLILSNFTTILEQYINK